MMQATKTILAKTSGASKNALQVQTAAHQGASMSTVAPLFTPLKIGRHDLSQRMVLPPLTRNRATESGVPQEHMALYYALRARPGGLLIAEGTYINSTAVGYGRAPGIYSQEQVDGWKAVTAAVKAKGAVFFNQLWHCGRAGHPSLTGGLPPVAPSAIPISSAYKAYTLSFQEVDYPVPEALSNDGIKAIIQDYRHAARNAIAAGFDGVEIHGASGYLVEQFLKSGTNQRTDEYGGSIENRCRFALEVVDAIAAEIGADRIGIRLSPFSNFLDAVDDTPYATYTYLVEKLNKHPLAYIHMVEGRFDAPADAVETLVPFRKVWKGPFIAAGGYTADTGAEAVRSGHADLIAYGRWWISNPDLPERFKAGAPLNKYNRDLFYAPGVQGYTDYPLMDGSVPSQV